MSRLFSCECCGLVSEATLPARCPRCDTSLHARKPLSLQRSAAFLVAAMVLYVPSNVLPVMSTRSVIDGEHAHTLIGGIAELWSTGSWELAVIVFAASIAVPITKMVVLALLIATALRGSVWRQRERSVLYRMLETMGHWSMLDVYVVVTLAGMVQFGALGSVHAEPGLLAFAAVVIFTMLASTAFDPRLIWPEEPPHGRTA